MAGEYADTLARPEMVSLFATSDTISVLQMPISPIDRQDGGRGRIVGTVKEKHTPSNIPLKRRVVLLNANDNRAIRETWSDPVSGVYEFSEIDHRRKYTVISYDHTLTYRAVVADNLSPDLML